MSDLREQCDFISYVVKRSILMGMDRKQFDKLADAAWLVHTGQREQPTPETGGDDVPR